MNRVEEETGLMSLIVGGIQLTFDRYDLVVCMYQDCKAERWRVFGLYPLCREHWALLPVKTRQRWNKTFTAYQREPVEQIKNILAQLRKALALVQRERESREAHAQLKRDMQSAQQQAQQARR